MMQGGNFVVLTLNFVFPQFIALIVEAAALYISAYFQSRYFGVAYYESALYYQTFINLMSMYFSPSLSQYFTIN